MNIGDVTNELKASGWSNSKDEVGDRLASYQLSDRSVDIIYGLREATGEQQLWLMLSTSTKAFSRACSTVDPGYGPISPLITAWKGLRILAPQILEEHVRQASHEAIAWAQEQDLGKALSDHAALPTNAPGARPIWHLAALGLLGETAKLKSYQASFASGDRLGFVNYVTKDYIDLAVALAEEAADGA